MKFDDAFTRLLGHEGGYVDHPADPGGETKFGISKRSYPSVDIKALTLEQAKAIYLRDYWLPTACDRLPADVRFHVFDMAVNSGVKAAIKTLQDALQVKSDGIIGSVTLAAIGKADCLRLVTRFSAARLMFMAGLSTWPTFGRGWARRIANNLLEV